MSAMFQIKESRHEARVPVTVFELAGELDAHSVEQFQKTTLQAIDTGTRYVILDLSQLSYISSAGLRGLFTLAKVLTAQGGMPAGSGIANKGSFKSPYLKLFNPSPNVKQVLDLMGFNMSMEIYSDLDQALASF